jgi:hypothetical protein
LIENPKKKNMSKIQSSGDTAFDIFGDAWAALYGPGGSHGGCGGYVGNNTSNRYGGYGSFGNGPPGSHN